MTFKEWKPAYDEWIKLYPLTIDDLGAEKYGVGRTTIRRIIKRNK